MRPASVELKKKVSTLGLIAISSVALETNMKKVIPRCKFGESRVGFVESPLFAKMDVEKALSRPFSIDGLIDLIAECGVAISDCHLEYHKQRILDRIEQGQWLLITNKPFRPIDVNGINGCLGSVFNKLTLNSSARGNYLSGGPGRWETVDIEHELAKNAVAFAANWLASRGDEGRIFLSEGKDYANTVRTIVQEWRPLSEEQSHLVHKSVSRYYGELRRIKQQYVEGDDHWQISGSSWHWRPVTMDIVYELKGE